PAGSASISARRSCSANPETRTPMASQDPKHDRRIDYIEIAATDIEATKRFYQSVFGWKFTDYGPDYTSFEDGRITGGFYKADSARPGSVLVVMFAVDLEA